MKVLFVLCFAALAGCASVNKECIYDDRGMCIAYCPEGTKSYTVGCGRVTPEPTCDNPQPVEEDFDTCDVSDCYCIPPTVRDTATKKCVTLDMCPKERLILRA